MMMCYPFIGIPLRFIVNIFVDSTEFLIRMYYYMYVGIHVLCTPEIIIIIISATAMQAIERKSEKKCVLQWH